MTFQVPLRQFTSLGVKFDLYGQFKLPLRSFTAFTTLRSFYVILLTLRKAVSWALRNFTYLVMSCKFAISCCGTIKARMKHGKDKQKYYHDRQGTKELPPLRSGDHVRVKPEPGL